METCPQREKNILCSTSPLLSKKRKYRTAKNMDTLFPGGDDLVDHFAFFDQAEFFAGDFF